MISFEFITQSTFIPSTEHKLWLNRIIRKEGKTPGDITYIFCDDEYILTQNIQFLEHDTYTDIITFGENCDDVISGSILVSVDRVADNAKQFSKDFKHEFLRVMAHGVLHLCGYKDKHPDDEKLMRIKENEALSLL